MMEVDVSGTDRFSLANVRRCAAHVAPLRTQERAGAGEQAPTILGVLAQVALDQGRGFGVLTKMQQRPGDVIVPKGRVLVRWDLSKDAQGVLVRSEEHTSELQSRLHLVCRLLLEKKKKKRKKRKIET